MLCLIVLLAVLLGAYFVSTVSGNRRHDHHHRDHHHHAQQEGFVATPDEDMSDMEIIQNPEDMDEVRLDSSMGTFGFGRAGNSFYA